MKPVGCSNVVVAERLRRQTRNLLRVSRAVSNRAENMNYFGEKLDDKRFCSRWYVVAECLKCQIQCPSFPSTKSTERIRVFYCIKVMKHAKNDFVFE